MVVAEMFKSLRQHLISKACILFLKSDIKVYDSKAYRNMNVTRECISFTFDPRDLGPVVQSIVGLTSSL